MEKTVVVAVHCSNIHNSEDMDLEDVIVNEVSPVRKKKILSDITNMWNLKMQNS